MSNWWRNLSVAKKLYGVVGIMAMLIAAEMFTLLFTMDVLSAVRSFVSGEGLWSKAQKDAVYNLQRYATTQDDRYYSEYLRHLQIPLGDRRARLELIKAKPDLKSVHEGFAQGEIHRSDIPGLIRLIRNFYWVSYVNHALVVWTEADTLIDDLMSAARDLRAEVQNSTKENPSPGVASVLIRIETLDDQFTSLEKEFSYTLGEGSRWLESLLKWLLLCAVFTVEATGVCLTFLFTRNLSRSLKELSNTAIEVGNANFSYEIPVRSKDELGQMAQALNQMVQNLKKNIGEREKAESASKIKSLFLANMSHEIRTPLGVILGIAEILKDKNISVDDHDQYVQMIERTGNNLKRIINDILDISKVEAGHLEIEKTTFQLSDFMKETQEALNVRAEEGGNKLKFVDKGEYPSAIHTDRIRLRQILLNLVGNALKFTKEGLVVVEYGTHQVPLTNALQLYFRVSDTGIGISPDNIKQLFLPFSQADNSITRQYEGTGLGLILSKRLAQSLGGDVILEKSDLGLGSTFLITVGLDQVLKNQFAKPSVSEDLKEVALQNKSILVVEDSPDNQLLLRVFLTRHNVRVDCANNGKEGLEKALKGQYDLVLMDVQMPIMDGHTSTAELRRQGYQKPIIALTAHAMKEDRERCLNAGCNDYLTKPIELPKLFKTLQRHLALSSIPSLPLDKMA
ncbi:MAG: response regulator [Bdellovibrionales bacterium]